MIGRVLGGRYTIQERIGGGGMSVVYRAFDSLLRRPVAVKVLRPEFVGEADIVRRFRQEAQAAASLQHANIVNVYDVGEQDGDTYFIVMEYVPGHTLKEELRTQGPEPPGRAAAHCAEILAALEEAHVHGIVHRDVKPQNVLLTKNGHAKVSDFGIARAAASTTIVHTQRTLGTAHYASPEQVRGAPTDERSDVYSVGCVLYEALTGQPPFAGEDALAVMWQHTQSEAPDPRELQPATPPELVAITRRALSKRPEDRYPSAAAMLADLERALAAGLPGGPVPGLAGGAPLGPEPAASLPATGRSRRGRGAAAASKSAAGGAGAAPAAAKNGASRAGGAAAGQVGAAATAADHPTPDAVPPWSDGALGGVNGRNGAGGFRRTAKGEAAAALTSSPLPGAAPGSGSGVGSGSEFGESAMDGTLDLKTLGDPSWRGSGTPARAQPGPQSQPQPGPQSRPRPRPRPRTGSRDAAVARRSRALRWAVTLGILAVLVAAAVLALSRAVQVPTVGVPDVVGKPQPQAVSQLISSGLLANVSATIPSDTVPPGDVIAANPPPGSAVKRGRTIQLTVSTGPEVVPGGIPNVAGLDTAAATAMLKSVGLVTTPISQYSGTVPNGRVIGTDPPVGSPARQGDTVTLQVSQGPAPQPVTMPVLVGRLLGDAEAALQALGLQTGSITQSKSGYPASYVVGSDPAAQAQVSPGQAVNLTVSSGCDGSATFKVTVPAAASAPTQLLVVVTDQMPNPHPIYQGQATPGSAVTVDACWLGPAARWTAYANGTPFTSGTLDGSGAH